jgi:cytidine deaminase
MDIEETRLTKLKEGLELCVLKAADKERSSSLAISKSGNQYLGALIGSDTNLMNVSSEQVALSISTASSDFPVTEIISMVESERTFNFSPIVLKVMVDYAIRTQEPLKYRVVNTSGSTLFQTDDVRTVFSLYTPEPIVISKIKGVYAPNYKNIEIAEADMPDQLKEFALEGLNRNFPLYDSASSYGTAVYTGSGKVYFAGQYSSPDKRLNLHSEMVAILSALMGTNTDIKAIGIVSSKYPDTPCNMCGICRQFIAEISAKLKISPDLYCFSAEAPEFKKFKIEEYLPDSWSSKKW